MSILKQQRALRVQGEAAEMERSGAFNVAARLWRQAAAIREALGFGGATGIKNQREKNYCSARYKICASRAELMGGCDDD